MKYNAYLWNEYLSEKGCQRNFFFKFVNLTNLYNWIDNSYTDQFIIEGISTALIFYTIDISEHMIQSFIKC